MVKQITYSITYQGIDLNDTGIYFKPDYPAMDKEEFDEIQGIMFENMIRDFGNELTQIMRYSKRIKNDF